MNSNPFQIARWSLLASFALMVAVLCLPNPKPSSAWKIAEETRYKQGLPEQGRRKEPRPEPPTQLANRNIEKRESPTEILRENQPSPFRTAQLPPRSDAGDGSPRGGRIQEPILFFEEDEPSTSRLAPDPKHLEIPRKAPESPPINP